MKTWNPEQKQAIELRHQNILVSASAGSGKTGVLVQRLVDLVTIDRIELDEILAMTFSEDAANEMKKRLSKEISSLLSNEKDEEKKAYLFKQLSKLSNAHISTIHSFCYSIIKEFYYLIDLTSTRISNLCDESKQQLYKNQALETVIETMLKEKNKSFSLLVSMLSNRPEDLQSVKDTILKTADMADSQSDPEKWLDLCKRNYEDDIFEKDSQLSRVFMDYWHGRLTLYIQAMESLVTQFHEHYPKEEKRYHTLMKKMDVLPKMNLSSFDEIRDAVLVCAKMPLPTSPDASNLTFKENRELIQQIEDEIISVPPQEIMKKMTSSIKEAVFCLIECVRMYLKSYETIKIDNEVIDFSDMEHFALKILKEHEEAAQHYRLLFKEIMVDEFQDSNDVQDELVHLICQKNNVFRVGDVKQSIYGFRHALPSIMQSYKEKEDEWNHVIRFNKNYRSDASIVEFNNLLFQILMNIEGFDSLPFKEEDLSQIGLESQKEKNHPIVFHALNPQLKSYDNEKINKDIYKAEYIAHEILNQLDQYDFKDFAILVRNNAKMDVLKNVFEKYNIPYYMNHKSGFYESRSIQILISALNAFFDPQDDIHFAALLTSIYFNFSSNDLANLSIQKKGSFYETLRETHPECLNDFEQIRSKERISDLILACFNWNDFYQSCSLQDQTNCDYFYQLALDYEKNNSCELSSFIYYLDSLKQQKTAQTSTIGKNDNVVRFMSIHNSKGLEFPVVYLWSSSSLRKMEMSDMVLCDNELGIGFTIMELPYRNTFKSYQRIAIEQKKNRDEIEEELRILYVATTRAKKELHIVDFVDPKLDLTKPMNYSKINARKGTTSWILQSLMSIKCDDLFEFRKVSAMWETTPLKKSEKNNVTIKKYQEETRIEILSPSETETTSFEVQPLTFFGQEGRNYGTLIHTYIQHLENRVWEEKDLQEIAQFYELELNKKVIHDLMTLNSNEIFNNLRKSQIYHEYPFLVKIDETLFTGAMDFLAIDEIITLIDFKSDLVSDEKILSERYQPQMDIYVQALHHLFPEKKVVAYLYSFHLAQMIQVI